MKSFQFLPALAGLAAAVPALSPLAIEDLEKRTVDTTYPYTGPAIPIGDWVDPTVNGNGKGFPRLQEPPAVAPSSKTPTNNVNVISHSYIPGGINVHYQTPFGLSSSPTVHWGKTSSNLVNIATGASSTYARTPPCSLVSVTQCSQFFHDVEITGLAANTEYYYVIPASNGTTASPVLNFRTAQAAGDSNPFTVAIVADMGYTNAAGTFNQLSTLVNNSKVAFTWHGGDISYADDWYSGILPCSSDWPVCYNGTSTTLPGSGKIPPEYEVPLPAGEVGNQGGPQGGDMNVIYESNWDLWQQWENDITMKVPYMVLPGNHEAACAEFDGGDNVLTAYLVDDKANGTAPKTNLTYFSCPPSQRNFTAFQFRFHMDGEKNNGGVGNFWYSFDYGLAHFISLSGETDFAYSPEWPFIRDTKGKAGEPTEAQTFITDSGPFGTIDGNKYSDNTAYQQIKWLKADLAAVNRTKTPWIVAMSHRPMYSSENATYQADVRAAFESLLLEAKADIYLSGHIHWYERLWPLGTNGTIQKANVINNNTYVSGTGTSLVHVINGMAGNIESHTVLDSGEKQAPITAVLNQQDYGLSTLTFHSAESATYTFVKGDGSGAGDTLTLTKQKTPTIPG